MGGVQCSADTFTLTPMWISSHNFKGKTWFRKKKTLQSNKGNKQNKYKRRKDDFSETIKPQMWKKKQPKGRIRKKKKNTGANITERECEEENREGEWFRDHAYVMSSVLKFDTIKLIKFSRIITARMDFQSDAFSPSSRQIDSSANFTTAGGFAIERTSTRCCFLIDFTAARWGKWVGGCMFWRFFVVVFINGSAFGKRLVFLDYETFMLWDGVNRTERLLYYTVCASRVGEGK